MAARSPVAVAVVATILIVGTVPERLPAQSRAPRAYGYAGVVPGLGHFLQDERREGAFWLAASVGAGGAAVGAHLAGAPPELVTALRAAGMNLWFTSMFDAYRDAGGGPETDQDRTTLYHYWSASWDVRYMLRWTTAVPLAAVGTVRGIQEAGDYEPDPVSLSWQIPYAWAINSMVATGEETLFRGFIQHDLIRNLGVSPWFGIPAQSMLFTAAHIPLGDATIYHFLTGIYLGVLAHARDYDVRENIFLHTVHNTILHSLALSASTGSPRIVLTIGTAQLGAKR